MIRYLIFSMTFLFFSTSLFAEIRSKQKQFPLNMADTTLTVVLKPLTIRNVQIALNKRGYKLNVDGFMGKATKKALAKYQEAGGFPACPFNEMWISLGLEPHERQ